MLLRLGTGSDEVLPADPAPSVRDLGAHAGFGQAWTSTSVRASVYLFDGYHDANAAEARLAKQVPEGQRGAGTVNGDLLLWTTVKTTDEAGRAIVERLLGAFAGEE
ncbi:hypothetical protein D7W81_18690 [Corallococcus aberystwythensis]|uniref:Uncharacterized protein n=1 Tax=Corallococcus aberystwythensis TaxID=2316722 RepID=A0A3A8Q870_9BACT|nr:hypothetical protein D7W81_18690 [Corallococcus aberystwythensis]